MSPAAPSSAPCRRWLLVFCIAVWLAAFVATHVPPAGLPKMGAGDVVLHFVGYFVLGTVIALTLASRIGFPRRVVLFAIVVPVYAAMDELTQALVRRSPAVGDWLADMAGAATALLLTELALAAVRALKRR